ncbi:PilZ domain-containing protein [Novosphingobium sp.]|uniref:PilZ domain-containing protein n=1 Tax=Novosphingobium sp. TaxID=1874826 RepID=UPI001EC55395|nr:PilZ domain-containing protein [Novosphingobium sp.]MBK6801668.1 PilZ domain-containing protein [Novosphingobium sp.]MBK9009963.1 PilZ domain-containing protein [Novosphingobium sp.]
MAMPVRVRNRTGYRTTALVTDLTEDGCALWFRSGYENLGRDITIQPEGMEGWVGRVAWRHDDRIGLQFDRPLYGPVVEHLIKRHPPF